MQIPRDQIRPFRRTLPPGFALLATLAALCLDAPELGALNLPLERPKSVTSEWIKHFCEKK